MNQGKKDKNLTDLVDSENTQELVFILNLKTRLNVIDNVQHCGSSHYRWKERQEPRICRIIRPNFNKDLKFSLFTSATVGAKASNLSTRRIRRPDLDEKDGVT